MWQNDYADAYYRSVSALGLATILAASSVFTAPDESRALISSIILFASFVYWAKDIRKVTQVALRRYLKKGARAVGARVFLNIAPLTVAWLLLIGFIV